MMTNTEILSLFNDCSFDDLTSNNYEEKIIDHLPLDLFFSAANGVSRLVIIPEGEDFVIKIPFTGNSCGSFATDYCSKEVSLYHAAKKSKVAQFFLKPSLVGYKHNHPIYTEPRAETYEDVCGCSGSMTYSSGSPAMTDFFPSDWIEEADCYYGEKLVNRFLNFFNFHELYTDMHQGNFGFRYNRPVIIDYAGFEEEQ